MEATDKRAATVRHRVQVRRVQVHLGLWYHRSHARPAAVADRVGSENASAATRDVAHHVAEVLVGRRDLDYIERLEKYGAALRRHGLESLNPGHLERHFVRVDRVI